MADNERGWLTSTARLYFRYGLLGLQVALVCLLLSDHLLFGPSAPAGVMPVQPALNPPPSGHKRARLKGPHTPLSGAEFAPEVPASPQRLFYNRVPKCGSHTFLDVIIKMAASNNFTFTRAPEYMRFHLEEYWQRQFVRRLRQIDTPMLYERHLHFINFPHYGLSQPVYINLVRDPLQRLVSWYYFRRFQAGHLRDMDETSRNRTFDECVFGNYPECTSMQGDNPEEGYFKVIPFFCGQQDFCRKDQRKALSAAMLNVDRNYLVVGVTEQFADYIGSLEHLLPTYFRGASQFYRYSESELWAKHRTTGKIDPSDDVTQRMHSLLENEYTFYKFVRQKFNKIIYGLRQKENLRKQRLANNMIRAKT